MKKLIDRNWQASPAKGPKPYMAYKAGQICSIIPESEFMQLMDLYYPFNRVTVISEHVDERIPYDYVVQPVGTSDRLRVSHWDLDPHEAVVESRSFAKAAMVLPGVCIKQLDTGEVMMVKDPQAKAVIMLHGNQLDSNDLVELMVPPRLQLVTESLIREQDPKVPPDAASVNQNSPEKLGRASQQRDQDQEMAKIIAALEKKFPSRDEVQKAFDKISKKADQVVGLKAALSRIGTTLK